MVVLERIVANPGTARILLSQLAAEGGRADRDELMRRIAPPGAGGYEPGKKDGDPRDETVEVLLSTGLIAAEGRELLLQVPDGDWDSLTSVATLRPIVTRSLFTAVEGREPFEKGLPRFAGALAWLLCQSPFRPILGFSGTDGDREASVFGLQEAQLGFDDRFFSTDRPWSATVRWAPFLGLAEPIRIGRRTALAPDPTVAIRDILGDATFGPASGFIDSLARVLPVLDGGIFRTAVEARWRGDEPPAPLSPSLSVALRRLQLAGAIRLKAAADAKPVDRVVLHLGERTQVISAVEVGERDG